MPLLPYVNQKLWYHHLVHCVHTAAIRKHWIGMKITATAVTHPIAQLHHWNRSRLEAGNHQFVSTAAGAHQVLVWRIWSRFIFCSWRSLSQLSPVYKGFMKSILTLYYTPSQLNYVDLSHFMENVCPFGISTGSQNPLLIWKRLKWSCGRIFFSPKCFSGVPVIGH